MYNIGTMNIISTAFENNELIPKIYTCDGKKINPPLLFSNIPDNAQSLVLIMEDSDAPNGTFVHWIVFNIPPMVREISEHSTPDASIEGATSAGTPGYVSPCPPSGIHHYIFTLYALDVILQIGQESDHAGLTQAMEEHILEKAQVVGLYKRS